MAELDETMLTQSEDPVVKALACAGMTEGLFSYYNDKEVYINGKFVDAYLLVYILAFRLASGDVEIVEKADSLKQREYFNKLMKACKNIVIPEDD